MQAVEPRPTLTTVARAAGVHASTVSRVLNPATRALVSSDVAARVEAVAAQLGYRPNAVAAGLRRGQSMVAGVVLPDITNPVFPPILSGIEAALDAHGYLTIVANAGDDPARQEAVLRRLVAQRVDGMVLATATREDRLLPLLRRAGVPAVLVNRTEDRVALPSVASDEQRGMALAVEHLVALGHRRIAHLAGPARLSTGVLRRRGFEAAVRAAGLEPDAIETASAYTRAAGRDACLRLLDGAPSAIVAANDLLALGSYDALAERGLLCPDDLSVVGHNDMPLVDLVAPPLTTIRIPHREMGLQAGRLLLRAMAEKDAPALSVVLRPELIVRGSAAPPTRRQQLSNS